MKITYFIFGLAEHVLLPDDTLNDIKPENLTKILKYSTKNNNPTLSNLTWLSHFIEQTENIPFPYAFSRLAYENPAFFDPKIQQTWLCADPVHIQINHDQLILVDKTYLDLTYEESLSIQTALNTFLKPDGIQFFMTDPAHWYLTIENKTYLAGLETTPLQHVVGRHIESFLPTGAHAQYWRKLFNEIQMFLFNLPLNEQREANGKLPINSLWFWGQSESTSLHISPYHKNSTIYSDNIFLHGIKNLTHQLDVQPLAETLNETILNSQNENIYITLEALVPFLHYQDLEAYRQTLLAFDTAFFAPTVTLLQNRKIQQVEVIFLDKTRSLHYCLLPSYLYKFWRRSKTLPQFL